MKIVFLIYIILSVAYRGDCQRKPLENNQTKFLFSALSKQQTNFTLPKNIFFKVLNLHPDHSSTIQYDTPMLTRTNFSASRNTSYWLTSVTSQSFNQNKFGTMYLWDVQGNLRESRTYFDIAGKNKRGWKLIFKTR